MFLIAGLFGLVKVDHLSARIVALQSLVGNHGNYTLRMRAQDRGVPAKSAYQNVDVCVSDFNDHSPVFVWPEQNTTIKVLENAAVGSVITTVSAVDQDVGLNSQIRYTIRPDPLCHWKWFNIDSVAGTLILAQPLDREKQKFYQVLNALHLTKAKNEKAIGALHFFIGCMF